MATRIAPEEGSGKAGYLFAGCAAPEFCPPCPPDWLSAELKMNLPSICTRLTAARADHLLVRTWHQRDEVAAEQALAGDLRHRVGRQPHLRIEAHRHHGEIGVGLELLVDHGADLDARQAHVGADAEPVDALELGHHVVAAHRPHVGRGVGEDQEEAGDDEHDRAHQGFDQISAHALGSSGVARNGPPAAQPGVHGS
jgi:hypothetical protein